MENKIKPENEGGVTGKSTSSSKYNSPDNISTSSPSSRYSRGMVSRRGGRGGPGSPATRTGPLHAMSDSHHGESKMKSSQITQIMRPHPEDNCATGNKSQPNTDDSPQHDESDTHPQTQHKFKDLKISPTRYPSNSEPKTHISNKTRSCNASLANSDSQRGKGDQIHLSKISQETSPLHTNPHFDASAMEKDISTVDEKQKQEKSNADSPKKLNSVSNRNAYSIRAGDSYETGPLHPSKEPNYTANNTVSRPDPKQHNALSKDHKQRMNSVYLKAEKKDVSTVHHLTYSPPPTSLSSNRDDDERGTPSFGQLTFHDAKLNSPSGLFLSPYSPCALDIIGNSTSFDKLTGNLTPSRLISGTSTNEKSTNRVGKSHISSSSNCGNNGSNESRYPGRDRTVTATPIGLSSIPSTPLKSPLGSNAFSWMASPSQGFLSPNPSECGRASSSEITTPTFSSMFFRDSKGHTGLTPVPVSSSQQKDENKDNTKRSSSKNRDIHRHHPYSKMICISPLASTKKRAKSTGDVPSKSLLSHKSNIRTQKSNTNETYNDILCAPFSSPTTHFDVHSAQKDLMEDEDLSVLLHLASSSNTSNTPCTNGGAPYSKSPTQKNYHAHGTTNNVTPSSLQLPLMGGSDIGMLDAEFPPKLSRMAFRSSPDLHSSDFTPPSIPSRKTGSYEIDNNPGHAATSSRNQGPNARRPKNDDSKSSTRRCATPSKGSKQSAKRINNTSKKKEPTNLNPTPKSKVRKKKKIAVHQNMHNSAGPPPSFPQRHHNGGPMTEQMASTPGSYKYPGNISLPPPQQPHAPPPHPSQHHPASQHPPPQHMAQHPRGMRPQYVTSNNNNMGPGCPPPPHGMNSGHPPPHGKYHDGMNNSSGPPPHPMGERRPMPTHHMPPSNYPSNPSQHMGAATHSIPPGPYHYHHPSQPPPMPPNAGQYAPYTSINQSHNKSKIGNKKNCGYAINADHQSNVGMKTKGKKDLKANIKRLGDDLCPGNLKKKTKLTPSKPRKKNIAGKKSSPGIKSPLDPSDKNAHAAALAAAILRGVTMRPSGKWQAQLYYAGKSRYIGVFDTKDKAALAYEIAREKLKSDKSPDVSNQCIEDTEAAVSSARKAAFEGVNEPDPRPAHKR